ncbi:F-box/LRR-repeat protein At3g59250-like [Papaver somniferum]|uniref:F-box/LRR-repeat protein At3g59250-like n=1 Tax=Papaver somniferum TaxID=3469 RepID=UPI000E6F6675|nr:F-box/LRR-repeat protein At3g59250-like [Papaver somniferum]
MDKRRHKLLKGMKGDVCRRPEDRISELPDTIIHHIFSFLETETIVCTSRLSKRWRYVWTTMPSFDLIVSCNIEELSLDLSYSNLIPFTRCLFNRESLVELRLRINISLRIPESISLPKLKLLQLSDIYFSDKLLVEQLILNSPLLEKLILSIFSWSNWNRNTLNISAPALKCLVLDGSKNYIGMRNGAVKIHAPNLMHFSYTGLIARDYTVPSFSSLEDAEICFKRSYYLEKKDAQIGHAASKLVGGISNVRSLTISGETLEALSFAYDDFPRFQNLIHLRVTSEFKTIGDKELLKFFQHAPSLESLVFDKGLSMWPSDMGNTFCVQGMASECPLPRLKSVHFKGISWSPREMDLIKLILKNAENLEKMTFKDITPPTLSSISSLIKDEEESGII